jgi:hypothetical protein
MNPFKVSGIGKYQLDGSSLAGADEPTSYLPHELVNLVGLQEGWFLFQFATPRGQDFMLACLVLRWGEVVHHLLDRLFPIAQV